VRRNQSDIQVWVFTATIVTSRFLWKLECVCGGGRIKNTWSIYCKRPSSPCLGKCSTCRTRSLVTLMVGMFSGLPGMVTPTCFLPVIFHFSGLCNSVLTSAYRENDHGKQLIVTFNPEQAFSGGNFKLTRRWLQDKKEIFICIRRNLNYLRYATTYLIIFLFNVCKKSNIRLNTSPRHYHIGINSTSSEGQ